MNTKRFETRKSPAGEGWAGARILNHRLSKCSKTGLERYRDRHQARDGARAICAGATRKRASVFACPDCQGFHLEVSFPVHDDGAAEQLGYNTPRNGSTSRRYVLVDVENITHGAVVDGAQLRRIWAKLEKELGGLTPNDHVVIGASRGVAVRYRKELAHVNAKWVIGANAPDAADAALLRAIDMRRVPGEFDELVIVSGDHAFAGLARLASDRGLEVHAVVVERVGFRSPLSGELRRAAARVSRIAWPAGQMGVVAASSGCEVEKGGPVPECPGGSVPGVGSLIAAA